MLLHLQPHEVYLLYHILALKDGLGPGEASFHVGLLAYPLSAELSLSSELLLRDLCKLRVPDGQLLAVGE